MAESTVSSSETGAGGPAASGPRRAGTARRGRLTARRKALGLTQEDLAALLGVQRSTVVRWERGDTEPLPWMRPRLAKALKVTADRLTELLDITAPNRSGPGALGQGSGQDDGTGPGDGSHDGDRQQNGGIPADSQTAVVPRQLPAAVADFTGRAAELSALTEILDTAGAGLPGTVVISAIGGIAGVGKTALALHWAHSVANRFPDGQLHVNLRGFDPSGIPATPEEAIRGFLDALGVPAERIPSALDAQTGLYRSLLADKRMLIVLDNARDEQQVRHLFPASPGSLVIVTSRNQLAGLAASHGAGQLSLDVLPPTEAVQLLVSRIGVARTAAEPDAVAEIAALCACLPLGLAVAAALATARPRRPLSDLAAELSDTASRLDALDAGDMAVSVRTVFSWSYNQLGNGSARMFRLLGLHPGPDISVPAAASLAATDQPAARRLLHGLVRASLLTEHLPGRYAFHDLLRAYAADQARVMDEAADRTAAVTRLLDYYLHAADAGSRQLRPAGERIVLPPPSAGTATEQIADHRRAMDWFQAEHRVLLASIAYADATGFDQHAWQLTWATMQFHWVRGHSRENLTLARTGVDAATRLGDVAGQAISSKQLANVYLSAGDFEQARIHYTASLELYRRLDNPFGQAQVYTNLGVLADYESRHRDALDHGERALELYRVIGHRAGEAETLNFLGWEHAQLGDFEQARQFCRRALGIYAEGGAGSIDRNYEGATWDSLGYAEYHLGNLAEADACFQRALGIARNNGDRHGEAEVLLHVADVRHAAGEVQQAADVWRQALPILDDLARPEADEVRARLADISGQQTCE